MGVVFLARGPDGRLVAVKVIRAEFARNQQFLDRFWQESEAARRVARFCTAPVLEAGVDADSPYLVTEYVSGPTLAEAVDATGPLSPSAAEGLATGVAAALTAIHAVGVAHRDLKPANVLLSQVGPRVIDFGIAKEIADASGLTGTGQYLGTPAFIAPEQITGEPVTSAVDVFAWGGVVNYARTGRLPFGSADLAAMTYRAVHQEPDLTGLDEPLRTLVAEAMRKEPAHRPTAQELLMCLLGTAELPESPAAAPAPAPTWLSTVPVMADPDVPAQPEAAARPDLLAQSEPPAQPQRPARSGLPRGILLGIGLALLVPVIAVVLAMLRGHIPAGVLDSPRLPQMPQMPGVRPYVPSAQPKNAGAVNNKTIDGIQKARTVACDGENYTVAGVRNNVTFTGKCGTLTLEGSGHTVRAAQAVRAVVRGIENHITIDQVETISASGVGNTADYRNGTPRVSKGGANNTVRRALVR